MLQYEIVAAYASDDLDILHCDDLQGYDLDVSNAKKQLGNGIQLRSSSASPGARTVTLATVMPEGGQVYLVHGVVMPGK